MRDVITLEDRMKEEWVERPSLPGRSYGSARRQKKENEPEKPMVTCLKHIQELTPNSTGTEDVPVHEFPGLTWSPTLARGKSESASKKAKRKCGNRASFRIEEKSQSEEQELTDQLRKE